MSSIVFNDDDFSVNYRGKTITLLPKEFELLHFLYRNRNQVFSRTHLLDAVWTMSDSYERTVDDHVYRLRKRLYGLKGIRIETIRGRGYRLILEDTRWEKNPMARDEQFQAGIDMLFQRYILYGQGKGLLFLKQHYDQIDVEMASSKKLFMHFITGQFRDLLEIEGVSFWEKAFYLLYLYSIIQFDAGKALSFYIRALKQSQLPPRHQREVEDYSTLRLLIDTDQKEVVRRKIQQLRSDCPNPLYLCNLEIYLTLSAGEASKFKIREGEILYSEYPYLREQGRFLLLKGLWSWNIGDEKVAKQLFDEGLNLLKTSEIVPSLIQGVHDVLTLVPEGADNIREMFTHLWEELFKQYRLGELALKLERVLNRAL